MTITLYNSLSREDETFTPRDPRCVTMYVCGPTVYDTPHIGNARPAVIFDVLFRLLRHDYEDVKYARNFTDIDDKIMARAKANGEDIAELTTRNIAEYHEIMAALNVMRPTFSPRATAFMHPIKAQISTLLMGENAYETENHVFFDTQAWPSNKLSRHKTEDLGAMPTIIAAEHKRHPSDFVLWKPSSDDQPGWESPWGRGRPGWHIECSAMIESVFAGQTIDIHGGGQDLRFPHHDCEIAQFEAAHEGRELANYWIHNAMVRVNSGKMAKSLGNFITVRDTLDEVSGAVVRLALLTTHYRTPLDWTDKTLPNAKRALSDWHRALVEHDAPATMNHHAEHVLGCLRSDLNTPQAIAELHGLTASLHTDDHREVAAGMRAAAEVLGFDLSQEANRTALYGAPNADEIEALMEQRLSARQKRDWAESDRLRAVLQDMGVVVEDAKEGSTWRLL